MGRTIDLEHIIISLVVLVCSISLHEFGHAIAADKLGDPGPRRAGRITLWPDKHFDPFGFLMMVFTMFAGFGIGWGKPVLVDPYYFKHPRRDMTIIALAGPAMNLLLALLFGLLLRFGVPMKFGELPTKFALFFLFINLGLMFFNLLPLHPLDGGKVMSNLLPTNLSVSFDKFMWQWGPIILLVCCMLPSVNILSRITGPAAGYVAMLILGRL